MSVVDSRRAHDRLSQLSRRSSREGIGTSHTSVRGSQEGLGMCHMSQMNLRSSQEGIGASHMSPRSSRGLGMRHNTFAHIDDDKPKLLFREGII